MLESAVRCPVTRTFLYNEPTKIVGFWVALEDCTANNGCMEYIPASQKGACC